MTAITGEHITSTFVKSKGYELHIADVSSELPIQVIYLFHQLAQCYNLLEIPSTFVNLSHFEKECHILWHLKCIQAIQLCLFAVMFIFSPQIDHGTYVAYYKIGSDYHVHSQCR